MWRSRARPTPLDFDGITSGTFTLSEANGNGTVPTPQATTSKGSSSRAGAGLKDQRALTLKIPEPTKTLNCISDVAILA